MLKLIKPMYINLKRLKVIFNNIFLLIYLKIRKICLFNFILKVENKMRKNKKILFILNADQIGNLFSSLKFSLCEAHKKKIKVENLIYVLPKNIVNGEFINLIKNNFKVYISDSLHKNLIHSPLIFSKNIYKIYDYNGWVDLHDLNFDFKFHNQAIGRVKDFLKSNNINNFICISNRDNFFYKNKSDFTSYRNSSFESYESTIIFLKKKYNYDSIRMGDYIDEKTINYTSLNNINFKKILDIYLPYFCKFSINNSSGLALIPYLFKKPQLICNAIPLGELPSIHNGIILPKIIKNSDNNSILKINDLLRKKVFKINNMNQNSLRNDFFITQDATRFQSDYYYVQHNLKIMDNSKEEILNSTKELIMYNIEKKKLNASQQRKQKIFKNLFPSNHPMRKTRAIISPKWLDINLDKLI